MVSGGGRGGCSRLRFVCSALFQFMINVLLLLSEAAPPLVSSREWAQLAACSAEPLAMGGGKRSRHVAASEKVDSYSDESGNKAAPTKKPRFRSPRLLHCGLCGRGSQNFT